jgi:hypothetical protein
MSLHALANQMAAKGRNSDSMLVHMAPQEVAGLQALAMKHGGSLTINPETGLVEANFLKKLLPAIAGFALNAFAPGFGSAIGGMLGLGGAAGTAIGVGGITGLATGSLSKGLMAGMGAYGGASLAGGVMGAGAAELAQAGAPSAANVAGASIPPIEQINPSNFGTNIDKLGAGFNAVTKSPSAFGDFAKQNAGSLLAVTSPLLADQGVQTVTKMDNPGFIRNFDYDPMTQRAKALNPVSVKSLGYPGYAGGGLTDIKRYADGGAALPDGSSQAAYNYLMGITDTTRPSGLATIPVTPAQPIYLPKSVTTTTPTTGDSGGGGGVSPITGGASVGNTPSVEIDPYDQAGQNAVSKLEREVAEETQYDREGQDAIDKYETEVEQERYDQEGQDAIDKYETEVEQERYDQEGQDAIDRYTSDSMPELEPPPFEPDNSGFYNSEFNTSRDIDDASISEGVRDSDFVPANPSDFGELAPASTLADDATIAVDVPNNGVTAMDNGNIEVATNQIAQQQPAAQPTVQDTPDGGAVVTMPEQPVVESSVADTFNPDTGTYVEVGNAGGDFGDGGGSSWFEDDGNSLDEDAFEAAGNANGGLMGYAMGGGLGSLGGYSDGGRLLRGPGDGVSDSIPAVIGKRQPARLADGEFVVPARIVSELGNGSTEAGARKLYKMMDRIQAARGKTVGKGRVAKNSRAEKHLPA